MNFYDSVTEENALEWYAELPAHLKRNVDQERSKFKCGRECAKNELPELYNAVVKELGNRPLKPAEPADPLDGYTHEQMEQYEAYKKWGARYDELLLVSLCVTLAPSIQRERRMLNEAMGINVDAHGLPSQAEGLDDVQAATVRWLQESGEMPLEFLARTYRSEEAKMSDRLTAARTLMDYVHRKMPQKQEIQQETKTTVEVDRAALKKLSAKELETLEELLKKAGGSGATPT